MKVIHSLFASVWSAMESSTIRFTWDVFKNIIQQAYAMLIHIDFVPLWLQSDSELKIITVDPRYLDFVYLE